MHSKANSRGGSNEQLKQNQIRLGCSKGDTRLFRNNNGALMDQNGRLVKFGLAPGSSDLIGWKTVKISSQDVGKEIAQFVAIEVKDKGKATDQQTKFINAVRGAGGIAGIAKSISDALALLGKK